MRKKIILILIIIGLLNGIFYIVNATEVDKSKGAEQNEEIVEKIDIQEETVKDDESQTKASKLESRKPTVTYSTHVQDIGWQKEVSDGKTSGTSGKAKRLEALKIKAEDLPSSVNIKYQVHIQDIGWQDWKENDELAGTVGKSKRLEAIKIKLENSEDYSISYRVHVQDIGWQSWRADGELAGTEGKSLRLEAIEIKIENKLIRGNIELDEPVKSVYYKGEKINVTGWKMANIEDSTLNITIDDTNVVSEEDIQYKARPDIIKRIDGYGTSKENPTPGFSFNIEVDTLKEGKHTLSIKLISEQEGLLKEYKTKFRVDKGTHISYSTHIQDIGWQENKVNGETSGTTGKGKRIEAIKIHGINLPEGVTIKYQAHVQDIGWQEWKKEDETSGTTGKGKRVEAIKIKLEGTEKYSVMYRAHVQNIGWQDWCYDGETAGTQGESLRIEAIQIKLVPKINQIKAKISIDNPVGTVTDTQQYIKGWVMTSVYATDLNVMIDNKSVSLNGIQRQKRQDVLNAIKGYGNEDEYNQGPGFTIPINFADYGVGTHTIVITASYQGKEITRETVKFNIIHKITYGTEIYGKTGYGVIGDYRGDYLRCYRYGDGPNVLFATFAIHGWEDKWAGDGAELITIANNLYNTLIKLNDSSIASKWTVYIFPGINLDGVRFGYTHNGPGRQTMVSELGNVGIDMNRCWQIGSSYKRMTGRNNNGTSGFQAYEAKYLRDFLLSHESSNGQTLLVDLHGWEQQLLGDEDICSYYYGQFPESRTHNLGRYGEGYLITWARSSLGSSSRTAKSALIELPNGAIQNHQSVISNNLSGRFVNATISMLRGM